MTVSHVIIGAGQRGTVYGRWVAADPEHARVVAIAEPDPVARGRLAAECAVPDEALYESWADLIAARPDADSAVIATQDQDHVGPATCCATPGTRAWSAT